MATGGFESAILPKVKQPTIELANKLLSDRKAVNELQGIGYRKSENTEASIVRIAQPKR